jgi:hypothetical protein
MQSTLKPKQPDDPHDVLEVAPGVVLVAPADPAEEELSNLLRAAARQHSDPQRGTGPEFAAGAPVPPVDTTFRPAAVGNVKVPDNRPSTGGRVIRGFTGFLLAVCIGVGAAAWQAYGDQAQRMIARWVPQSVPTSSQPSQAAVQASAANAASPQPAAPPQAAAESVAPTAAAPSSGETQSLQSMARDLAAAQQEIEQLKASIAQLGANQEQMSRDVAKVSEAKASETKASEPNPRPRISAPPPHSAAPARRPIATYRPSQAAVAPMMPPPSAAPYVPRQPDPLPPPASQVPLDPELSSVPRPPMPVR